MSASKKVSYRQCIMIAGGGTGGHIYPAIAIGRALQKKSQTIEVRYVGTALGLEQKIMSREGLALDLIQSGKLNFSGHFFQKLMSLFKIPVGFFQSINLIRKYQPGYVLGVGGYASAPFLLAAVVMGCRTAIWEPNAHPGMANRWLSRFVGKAFLVFPEAQKFLKAKSYEIAGMPLREAIEIARESKSPRDGHALCDSQYQSNEARQPKNHLFTILCFGGSQGSLFLNTKISDFILQHPELKNEIRLIHQTGSLGFVEMRQKYGSVSNVELHEFIYNMPDYFKQADIQFCRGGASTIAEAACFGVIPIIVPLPAADNHQQKNAEAVVKNQAGFMILQKDFDEQKFAAMLNQLRTDKNLRLTMSENLKQMAPVRAADRIAEDILRTIR